MAASHSAVKTSYRLFSNAKFVGESLLKKQYGAKSSVRGAELLEATQAFQALNAQLEGDLEHEALAVFSKYIEGGEEVISQLAFAIADYCAELVKSNMVLPYPVGPKAGVHVMTGSLMKAIRPDPSFHGTQGARTERGSAYLYKPSSGGKGAGEIWSTTIDALIVVGVHPTMKRLERAETVTVPPEIQLNTRETVQNYATKYMKRLGGYSSENGATVLIDTAQEVLNDLVDSGLPLKEWMSSPVVTQLRDKTERLKRENLAKIEEAARIRVANARGEEV